ncbi:L,D-transpeptidase [Paenibacillus sp. FA6]|uniref:L,D-transpeptidase n=1 Tax=Paenibacillus sp. FA6 TaxID=3413029 RepID=UPI003F65FDEF
MKDSIYLKEYVKLHPENKMGWYLLGKEYEKNGQEGKANYCFNQSSEVFEAFEKSKVPDDVWKEYEDRILQISRHKERRTRKIRVFLLALIILLLTFIPSIQAPENRTISGTDEEQIAMNEIEQKPETIVTKGELKQNAPIVNPLFTAQPGGSTDERAQSLSSMLAYSGALPARLAVLGMAREDKWLLWKQNMPISFTLEKTDGSQVVYQPYDPNECECTPPDDTTLKASSVLWVKKQEELAALSGAIRFFVKEKGRVPKSFSELVQPFPHNRISGSTEVMKKYFNEINASFGATVAATTSTTTSKGDSSTTSGNKEDPVTTDSTPGMGGDMFFEEPLEIIVDKKNYRLAVVSGNIILRNYKVGLGGDRTPEDDFIISDKVVNPNGRSNGEFGSRGMQLSSSNYAIHGTDEPDSIGRDESLGCIRMEKADVEELFDLIPMGTKVRIEKGVLPDKVLVPTERYRSQHRQDQTNPLKRYRWLN